MNTELSAESASGLRNPTSPWVKPAETDSGSIDPTDLLHSFRRQGWLACGIGGVIAILVSALVFLSQEPQHRATALLRISATGNRLVFRDVEESSDFEIFKGTQKQLIESRFVMTAALRDPKLAGSRILQEEDLPVQWMVNNVIVSSPPETEIMRIAFRSPDAGEAVNLVNAVVDAYQVEVVNYDRSQRQRRLDELQNVATEKEAEVRKLSIRLKRMAEEAGGSESGALSAKQEFLVMELGELRRQSLRVQADQLSTEANIEMLLSRLTRDEAFEDRLTSNELDMALAKDAIYNELQRDKIRFIRLEAEAESAFKTPRSDILRDRLEEQYGTVMEERRQQIEDEMEGLAPLKASEQKWFTEQQITELEAKLETLKQLQTRLDSEIEDLTEEASLFTNQSIDLQMLRGEMSQLDRVLESIAAEREQLEVELQSRPRIQVLNRAEEAEPESKAEQLGMTAAAGLIGFSMPFVLVIGLDFLNRRVNGSSSLARRGIPVLGRLPVVSPKALGSSRKNKKNQIQQNLMRQSAARLAMKLSYDSGGDSKLVLVTSAGRREGKTTVSCQLASALASLGNRVLLVDLDFRNAGIAGIFGLEDQPGMSECLSGDVEIAKVIVDSGHDGLSVLPAGQAPHSTAIMSSPSEMAMCIKELKQHAEFVIVDAPPTFPSAEIAQLVPYADFKVLVALRDTSRVRDVQDSFEYLGDGSQNSCATVVIDSIKVHSKDRDCLVY